MNTLPISSEHPWLAPLAGYSDLAFRLLCKGQGAAVTCTEMVSAKGLVYGVRGKSQPGTEGLLATVAKESPLVVQLFGAEADFLGQAVAMLVDRGYSWFDLNMGCSVPKVVKTGAGAAMLKDVDNALAVAKAMLAAAGPGKVGFKLRLGWDAANTVYLDLAKGLCDLGAGWLTLHPRYAKQAFTGQADWQAIARLRKAVTCPVMASGDLTSAVAGRQCLKQTGAHGLMFARGAMGNPAVFRQYLDLAGKEPQQAQEAVAAEDLQAIILEHIRLAREHTPGRQGRSGLPQALVKMRTFIPRYVRHLQGVKHLRPALAACASWQDLEGVLSDFFGNLHEDRQKIQSAPSHNLQDGIR